MNKCKECGMPLSKGTECACDPNTCYHCCKCGPACQCGCRNKDK